MLISFFIAPSKAPITMRRVYIREANDFWVTPKSLGLPYSLFYTTRLWKFLWNKYYKINKKHDYSWVHLGLFSFSLFCPLVDIYKESHFLQFLFRRISSRDWCDIRWCRFSTNEKLKCFVGVVGMSLNLLKLPTVLHVLTWKLINFGSHLSLVCVVFIHIHI